MRIMPRISQPRTDGQENRSGGTLEAPALLGRHQMSAAITPILLTALSQKGALIPQGGDNDTSECWTDRAANVDTHAVQSHRRLQQPWRY